MRSRLPHVRITRRGWVTLAVAATLLIGLIRLGTGSAGAGPDSAAPAVLPTPTPSVVVPSPTRTPVAPAATPTEAARAISSGAAAPRSTTTPQPSTPSPTATRTGIVTTNTPSSGVYLTSTATRPATKAGGTVHAFVVKVETTVGQDADAVALELYGALADPRGWTGFRNHAFALVGQAQQPALTIYLAAPATVDRLCAPATPHRVWNCRAGDTVVLNIDRWLYATPTWSTQPLADYRAYMLNHEVGHYLGLGHVACPGAGRPAPVMMQQSITLGGCRVNAWPQLGGG